MKFINMNQDSKINLYELSNFNPTIIDQKYLSELGITTTPDADTLSKLLQGSRCFVEKYEKQQLGPKEYFTTDINMNQPMEIHNYTGRCPTNTFEITPIEGSCHVGCLYCLVNDGEHHRNIAIYRNYPQYLAKHLSQQGEKNVFYYFSPKTEALQEPTLQTGIAHKILEQFIIHYEKNPSSQVRIYLGTKAGVQQLLYKYEGNTILDLLTQLRNKLQFNLSIGIMPEMLYSLLEPNAADIQSRLRAALLCQKQGILANAVMSQPILGPYLTDNNIDQYFKLLQAHNIINFKPEFLTASMENLAMIAQIVGWHDKSMEKKLFELYISPENKTHKKQRGRTAPEKFWSYNTMRLLQEKAHKFGITTSICYWVREQLQIGTDIIPIINKNGFQCLGYQTKLFDKTHMET